MSVIPRKSASLLVCAARGLTAYSVLLLKRGAGAHFLPNTTVFPGGVCEEADASSRVAALRETFEESGLLLARNAQQKATGGRWGWAAPQDGQGREGQQRVARDASEFTALVKEPPTLVPWTRWITPAHLKYRFDADFFVTTVEREMAVQHDRKEMVEGAWHTPAEALRLHDEGSLVLPHTTWYTLHELATQYGTQEKLQGELERRLQTCRTSTPLLAFLTSNGAVLLPGDEQYPYAAVPSGSRHRLEPHILKNGVKSYTIERHTVTK